MRFRDACDGLHARAERPERGNVSGVSESVLEALGLALQLDDAERAHLFDLALAANPRAGRRR